MLNIDNLSARLLNMGEDSFDADKCELLEAAGIE